MNKLHFTALSLCLMAIGCTNDESFYEQSEIDDNGVVVLQERNAALPKEIRTRPVILEDKTATRAVNESGGIIGNSDVLLGYSYSIGNSILGDYENVISPVIDLMKVKEYGSDYITGRSLQVYMSERFSYSDYNSYESKLSQTKKVASGFQLNLGLYKFAEVNHCLPIEQVTDEVINLNQINRKEKTKQKRKQSIWDSGHLYQRLILDTMDGNDWFSKMIEIYHSWICKYLDNDKKPIYWQPRSYIRECYLQHKIL